VSLPPTEVFQALMLASLAVPIGLVLTWIVRPLRSVAVALAPWAALPALGLALLKRLDQSGSVAVGWEGISTGLRLELDGTGGAFLLLTSLLWVAAGAFARSYHRDDEGRDRFFAFFAMTMAGNLAVVLAGDVLSFYVAFAIMTFSAYGLVVHQRDAAAMRAGRVYIVLALAGEAALLMGIFSLGAAAGGQVGFGAELAAGWEALAGGGTPGVDAAGEVGAGASVEGANGGGANATGASGIGPFGSAPLVAMLLVIGFGVKAGIVPLHVWLPLAHPVAPTAASALLSGAMIKAGLLGWLRFLPEDQAIPLLGGALVGIGAGGALYGVLVGLAQKDPKTVLAYSSVSQMGSMAIGVGVLLLAPLLAAVVLPVIALYALHHGLAKGALFLSVGVAGWKLRDRSGESIPDWRPPGWWPASVLIGAALPALALAGAPLTSGAGAKTALKGALSELGGVWYAILDPFLLIAATGTTLLMIRFLFTLRQAMDVTERDDENDRAGENDREGKTSRGRDRPRPPAEGWLGNLPQDLQRDPYQSLYLRLPWGLILPWGALSVLVAAGGWWIPHTVAFPPGTELPSPVTGLLPLLGPLLLGGGVGATMAWRPHLAGRWAALRIPPGDLLVLLALPRRWAAGRLAAHQGLAPGFVQRLREVLGAGGTFIVRQSQGWPTSDVALMRGLVMGGVVMGLVLLLIASLLQAG